MSDRLEDLAYKLLTSFHLSVPERDELPGGKMPFSALAATVESTTATDGWFPYRVVEGSEEGNRVAIERVPGEYRVHWQLENGLLRYGPINVERVRDLRAAIRRYVDLLDSGSIDGVEIDWST